MKKDPSAHYFYHGIEKAVLHVFLQEIVDKKKMIYRRNTRPACFFESHRDTILPMNRFSRRVLGLNDENEAVQRRGVKIVYSRDCGQMSDEIRQWVKWHEQREEEKHVEERRIWGY